MPSQIATSPSSSLQTLHWARVRLAHSTSSKEAENSADRSKSHVESDQARCIWTIDKDRAAHWMIWHLPFDRHAWLVNS